MKYVISGALLVLFSLVLNSCNKEKDTLGVVYVFDVSGKLVEGADVVIYAPESGPGEIREGLVAGDKTGVTNDRGKVVFNFSDLYEKGSSGFAVLDVEAFYYAINDTNATDTIRYRGDGVIKLVEEESTELDIVIYPL